MTTRPPNHPEHDSEIIDPTLAEFNGDPAWIGIAWIPKDRNHPYHQARQQAWAQHEAEQAQANAEHFQNRLPTRYRKYTLANLRRHPGNAHALDAAKNLDLGQNLYLWGAAGNGKTHLAIATGHRLAKTGQHVTFHGVVSLFTQIRASFAPDGPGRPNLELPDILILDDLGKIKPTEFVFEVFYGALEARWSNEKTTIFTANHRPSAAAAQLAPDSESAAAILSRMASGVVVEVKGKDERLPT